jgi:hypothetical protein
LQNFQDKAADAAGDTHERANANKIQRQIAKKNIETTQNFLAGIVAHSHSCSLRLDKQVEGWDKTIETQITGNLSEVVSEDYISERTMRKAANL